MATSTILSNSVAGLHMIQQNMFNCHKAFHVRRRAFLKMRSSSDPNHLSDGGSKAFSISNLELLKTSPVDRYTQQKSCIGVIGLNIHTAPVEMREKLAIPKAEWGRAITELCNLSHIEEAAVLSTCNRMEIYVVAYSWNRGVHEVTKWMAKRSGISAPELRQHFLLLRDYDATQHLFEVSAGLDSLILGECQILAQVKDVVKVCEGVVGFNRKISTLFKNAIYVGKLVRSTTKISEGAVSIGSAAVELALMKLPGSSSSIARMLVIGAGCMGKLVIKHLVAKGYSKIVVVNRSMANVSAICDEIKQDIEIIYKPPSEMLKCIAESDVIFTSTSSRELLFKRESIEILPSVPPEVGGLRLFIDISVPRNVGSCVSSLDTARVYCVDNLDEVVAINRANRKRKAMEAQRIVIEKAKYFEAGKDSSEAITTLKLLRAFAEKVRVSELQKYLPKIGNDVTDKTKKTLERFSRSIVNKILHGPTQHLRCDVNEGSSVSDTLENMRAINRMYDLENDIVTVGQKVQDKVDRSLK